MSDCNPYMEILPLSQHLWLSTSENQRNYSIRDKNKTNIKKEYKRYMKHLILLIPLIVLLSCCKTQTLSDISNERIIHGYTYDNTSGEGLNGTFVYNLTQGIMTVADSTGRFKLKVSDGDSIRFKYVGMKDSVILISKKTPSNLQVGLDTANTTLIGNEIVRTHSSDVMHKVNGWYPVAEFPENKIEGEAFVTAKDFAEVSLDTVSVPDMAVIEGRLKAEKIQKWADATEARIGKRIGFVFNDSVIMAPTVNCRIESGSFTINRPDKALIIEIFNSLKEK